MKKVIILIFGKPGTGKSSIARLVSQRLNYDFIDVGSEIRDYMRSPQNLNLEVAENVSKGLPLSLNMLNQIIAETGMIDLLKQSENIIIDGIPRDQVQFENIGQLIPDYDLYKLKIALVINSSNKSIFERCQRDLRLDHEIKFLAKRIKGFTGKLLPLIYQNRDNYFLEFISNSDSIDACVEKVINKISNHLKHIENKNITKEFV